jgi:S-methylmethionine-dependent homocysteine/selenocysteine methylase
MARYRDYLPQLDGGLFLTDGGSETTLIFHEGIDLPYFAAFILVDDEAGRDVLRGYYNRYAAIARANGAGFILESPTWRASADWGTKLGYSREMLAETNRRAIALMAEIRDSLAGWGKPVVVSGQIGPRGDGYDPSALMSPEEAEAYHGEQIRAFAAASTDMVTALTMTNVNEAVGLARAAKAAGMPVAISFTLETDGRLPTGQNLKDAIEEVDATTGAAPAYFMINCAHPTHFEAVIDTDEAWVKRIRGIRANASTRSHAELDEATDLDDGNPEEFGRQHAAIRARHPQITVLGGCCGTDHRHVKHICGATRKAA